jgi:hypothetical protein
MGEFLSKRLFQSLTRRSLLSLGSKAILAPTLGHPAFTALWNRDSLPDDCTSALPDAPSVVKSFVAPEHQTGCVVTDEPKVGLFFSASAILDPAQTSYLTYEYRQYVKGYMCYRTNPTASWEASALNLRGNNLLSPSKYQEDGFPNGAAYGYRDNKYVCCDDDFGPKGNTRQNGWIYTMADFPGLAAPSGIEYQIKLDFCLQLVDTSAAEPAPVCHGRLKVRCCGALPATRVCYLPEDPPCPLHWIPFNTEDREVLATNLKPMGDYSARIFVDRERDYTVVRVAIVKSNSSPRIDRASLHLHLIDENNAEIPPLPVPGCFLPLGSTDVICEVNSASTTAQALFLLAPTKTIKSAQVTLPDRSVFFEPNDFNLK